MNRLEAFDLVLDHMHRADPDNKGFLARDLLHRPGIQTAMEVLCASGPDAPPSIQSIGMMLRKYSNFIGTTGLRFGSRQINGFFQWHVRPGPALSEEESRRAELTRANSTPKSTSKNIAFEHEIAARLRAALGDPRQDNDRRAEFPNDILSEWQTECRMLKRVNAQQVIDHCTQPADSPRRPLAITRENGRPILATLHLDDFLALLVRLRELEAARSTREGAWLAHPVREVEAAEEEVGGPE